MKAVLFLSVFMIAMNAWADLTIFNIRKNLPMSDDEKVLRDFYINAGSEAGLATGMVITVQRRMPLYDSYQNRSGNLDLKVAKIKSFTFKKVWLLRACIPSSLGRTLPYWKIPLLWSAIASISVLRLAIKTAKKQTMTAEKRTSPSLLINRNPPS